MTPEEVLTTTKTEIIALLEKLPIKTLETIKMFATDELNLLNPFFAEAESRANTIWEHLINSIHQGEHQIVTDVHEFLLSRKPSTVAPEVTPETVSTVTKDITPEVTASVVAPAVA